MRDESEHANSTPRPRPCSTPVEADTHSALRVSWSGVAVTLYRKFVTPDFQVTFWRAVSLLPVFARWFDSSAAVRARGNYADQKGRF